MKASRLPRRILRVALEHLVRLAHEPFRLGDARKRFYSGYNQLTSFIIAVKSPARGVSMTGQFDPKLLRKLAANYRRRAKSEPSKARLFLEIAVEMEAEAARLEN